MKTIFVYDCKIINSELLVVVSKTAKEIKKWVEKRGSKGIKNVFKDNECLNDFKEAIKKHPAFVIAFKNKDILYYILYLEKWENNWEWINILNHEIVHYKQYQFKDRGIKNENEFEAYFIETVSSELRQILNKKIK